MWRVWAGLALVAGCGRFEFERRADAAVDTEDDASPDAFVFCHTGTWSVPTPLTLIDTPSHESDPSLTADGLTMFYTSNRTTSPLYAIWMATRPTTNDPFGAPSLVAELDAPGSNNDQDPSISPDGLTIYFDSDRGGTSEIYVATRSQTTEPFGNAVPVVINGEPQAARASPAISADGLDLYYASGGLEIAHATRATTADDFTFVRLVSEVNVPSTDATPAISADGLELFFETYRNGPAELFRSTRATKQDVWSTPVAIPELVAGIPSANGYGGPELSSDGRTLYVFINDASIDIYAATRGCD